MRKPAPKAEKIKAALAKGMPPSQIAKKYGVTPAYVYTVRKQVLATAPGVGLMVPKDYVQPEPMVPAPAPALASPPPPTMWDRVWNFFGGAK